MDSFILIDLADQIRKSNYQLFPMLNLLTWFL